MGAIQSGRYVIGPGDVYIGVTAPANGASAAHSNGVPGSGQYIGSTAGPTIFIYKATVQLITAEQARGAVDAFIAEEEASIQFSMKEFRIVAAIKDIIA